MIIFLVKVIGIFTMILGINFMWKGVVLAVNSFNYVREKIPEDNDGVTYGKLLDFGILKTWCGLIAFIVGFIYVVVPPEFRKPEYYWPTYYSVLAIALLFYFFSWLSIRNTRNRAKIRKEHQSSNPAPKVFNDDEIVEIIKGIHKVPKAIRLEVAARVRWFNYKNPQVTIDAINTLASTLPNPQLLKFDENGTPWGVFIRKAIEEKQANKKTQDDMTLQNALHKLSEDQKNGIVSLPLGFEIPPNLRSEHTHIVAGSGYGKTQLIQSMILKDLDDDCSIVVIDSQNELINKVAAIVPEDRLILVDPEHCPPALNLFQKTTKWKEVTRAVELYEYIFSSLDAEMTSKQATAYRFVCRLLLSIPNANIHTMRELLEPDGVRKYQQYINRLEGSDRSFFENEYSSRQFNETRQQILRRLYTVLENKTLERMLGATESRLNIAEALDDGKVILISTAKSFLMQSGASLFGRIFIAQVMQAVMARASHRKKTFLYIDEFQDYAEDSHVLFNLFEQARKYNLGMIVAHQYLAQLPPKLQQSISANTAIKFAGGVSAHDASALAGQMHTTKDFILQTKKGTFAAFFKGIGTVPYRVEFGELEKVPKVSSLAEIHERMNKLYGLPYPTEAPPLRAVAEPPPPPYKGQGSGGVDEKGEW